MVTTSITELDSDIIRKDRGTNLIFAYKSGKAASTQAVAALRMTNTYRVIRKGES